MQYKHIFMLVPVKYFARILNELCYVKKIHIPIILLSLFIFSMLSEIHAQSELPKHEWREFDKKQIEKFRSDKDFDYHEKTTTKSKETLNWLEKLLERLFRDNWSPEVNNGLFDLVTIIIIVLIMIIVIWALSKAKLKWIITGKGAKSEYTEMYPDIENIHEISYEEEIKKAEKENNFRKAIRLHYLKLLKELTDKDCIEWQPQKTNHEYSSELRQTHYAFPFNNLTNWFEYTWYGGFITDESLYLHIKQTFLSFPEIKPKKHII